MGKKPAACCEVENGSAMRCGGGGALTVGRRGWRREGGMHRNASRCQVISQTSTAFVRLRGKDGAPTVESCNDVQGPEGT